ncbi:MAG: MFS transporter [Anaerolineales bacterium]|nr:MAG: MFS transporter [Anaerolineales bacterium]
MRNVLILSIALALAMSGLTIVVLLGGILGAELAPIPILTTLPAASMIVGLALFTLPAAFLMKAIGRRIGFVASALMAGLAALLAGYAIGQGSFVLLCVATFFIGAQGAFVQQYRFGAIESVAPSQAGRAVSFVLLGGIAAGFIGPEIAVRGSVLVPETAYVGSFYALAALYLLAAVALLFYKEQRSTSGETTEAGRPLREVAAQPSYRMAVVFAAVSFGVMTLVMTATPVYLSGALGYSLGTTSNIIKSHIAAMYIPSLFTGFLIDRFGLNRVMMGGALTLLASTFVGVGAASLLAYYAALILLGLGWNFLFVGATVLLTRTYTPEERFRAQALNDFVVFGAQAIASLSAGAVLQLVSWDAVNLIGFALLVFTLGFLVWGQRLIRAVVPA